MFFVISWPTTSSHTNNISNYKTEIFSETFENLIIQGAAGSVAMNKYQQRLALDVPNIHHVSPNTHWLFLKSGHLDRPRFYVWQA